ncbi:hypothetical protein N305_00107, partial [Manacus vitellinus]
KWRLLHDLRAVNAIMKPMGALQPGLPSPAALPQQWQLLIIDLKDCFFSIPLHPEDTERFAFTVPQKNAGRPSKRYEWVVLPQGMRNSPTICQWYVDLALDAWVKEHSEYITYHYMDDILIASPKPMPEKAEKDLIHRLQQFGLTIAPEKVQRRPPWQYLGMLVTETRVRPGKLQLQRSVSTINDVQKLVGDIQWIRTWCGITNEDLAPLFSLL